MVHAQAERYLGCCCAAKLSVGDSAHNLWLISMHAETAYLQALREQSGSKTLPALVELLSLHVCAS